MKRICVIGTGYVGLVTGACLAELGNDVVCIDSDGQKIESLQRGEVPFYEPGLQELVVRNQRSGRIRFTGDSHDAMRDAEIIFIAVGTPMADDGHADLEHVRAAAEAIASCLKPTGHTIVVNKSTVPVETGDLVASILREHLVHECRVSVVSNPEFLREGSAISDFMQPDRIVLGVSDKEAAERMKELYEPLSSPIFITDVRTAEMIKYTANAFLATKISFINEIANICDRVGADVKDVVAGAGADRRIGTAFMNPGLGFGGSCFPKDVKALSKIAEANGLESKILHAVLDVNHAQVERAYAVLEERLGGVRTKCIAVFGLAFKPNTDDVRGSPAIRLISRLLQSDAIVVAHDPEASNTAKAVLGDAIRYVRNCYEAVNEADALVIATDWNEYKQVDLTMIARLMRGKLVYDGRNIYDAETARNAKLDYVGVGHGSVRSHPLFAKV
jgi:UDPglucose 6-dehydrogenase